jgi:hypothetical protein
MAQPDVSAFVAAQRARRAAAGKSSHLDAVAVYRILDGLLANRDYPANFDASSGDAA